MHQYDHPDLNRDGRAPQRKGNKLSTAPDRERRRAFGPLGALAIAAFVLTVPAANWMVLNIGSTCFPDGPCVIPVWPGLLAPSGVALAGLSLVLRDPRTG